MLKHHQERDLPIPQRKHESEKGWNPSSLNFLCLTPSSYICLDDTKISSYLELDHTQATWKAQWRCRRVQIYIVSSSDQLSEIEFKWLRTHHSGPNIFWGGRACPQTPPPKVECSYMCSYSHPTCYLSPPSNSISLFHTVLLMVYSTLLYWWEKHESIPHGFTDGLFHTALLMRKHESIPHCFTDEKTWVYSTLFYWWENMSLFHTVLWESCLLIKQRSPYTVYLFKTVTSSYSTGRVQGRAYFFFGRTFNLVSRWQRICACTVPHPLYTKTVVLNMIE